jgi:hypothetical protein
MEAEIEPRPLHRRIDNGQALHASFTKGGFKAGQGGDVPPAERTVQPSVKPYQHRTMSAEIVEGDFAFAGHSVKNDVRRPVTRSERTLSTIG